MPATPGTSTQVTVDPAIGFVASTTWDPFVGIEAGRTITEPTDTTSGGGGADTLSTRKK